MPIMAEIKTYDKMTAKEVFRLKQEFNTQTAIQTLSSSKSSIDQVSRAHTYIALLSKRSQKRCWNKVKKEIAK